MDNVEASRIGEAGERLFREYADAQGIPYLWIDQKRETTPAWLRRYEVDGDAKRPDAIVPTSGDVILVDAKHRKIYGKWGVGYFALDLEDAERLAETERRLGKRVLLAYKDNEREDGDWYGILLNDVLVNGVLRDDGPYGPYYAVALGLFERFEEHVDVNRRQERLF